MTISSGFFNSHNHDRLYDAEQLSSIFDGVIIDGVYENYGDAFMITANPEANSSVLVGTGRAWFDHTWTLNDSTYALQLDPPNEMLGRIDAIVIDVDHRDDVRKNSIIYVKGSESTSNIPPSLVNEELHHQYPIAYITRPAGPDSPISQSQIDYQVGTTGDCPIVTGILESQNLENIWQQLNAEFDEWWDGIKATLDENTVTHLQNQINELKEKIEGDDALVGLLTKPAYEAFKSGDYGLNVSSYSYKQKDGGSFDTAVNDAFIGACFLPDGYVFMSYISSSDISGQGNPTYKITADLINTDGVSSKTKSPSYYQSTSHEYALPRINVFPISINQYPVKIGVVVINPMLGGTGTGNHYWTAQCITITITSSKNVSFEKSDFTEYSIYLSSSGVSSVGYLAATHGVSLSDGKFVTACGQDTTAIGYSRSSDGILTSKKNESVTNSPFVVTGTGGEGGTYLNLLKDGTIEISAPYFTGTPLGVRFGGTIDPTTLVITGKEVINSGDMAHPVYNWQPATYYSMHNPVTTYSATEQGGLTIKTIEDFSDNSESEKINDYFIGASNANISLPEGDLTLINTTSGYIGITSSGNHIFIGSNGGSAILKKKIASVPSTSNKRLMWLKGYINTDNLVGYLYATPSAYMTTVNKKYDWLYAYNKIVQINAIFVRRE